MGYVFDFHDAAGYDAWFEMHKNRYCLEREIRLMMTMLAPAKGGRLLDIGCGTGISLAPFLDMGLDLTGVDPSPYMLDIASAKFRDRVTLHKCHAEDLPFEDNSFEYAVMFTSLEFSDRPAKAIEEACRVTKDRIFIGVLNRYAPINMVRRARGFFRPNIYSNARFFGIWELRQILLAILGKVPITWKTTLQFPCFSGRAAGLCEDFRLTQRSPFGTLIGMKIEPVPRFRTRPLALKIKTRKSYKQAAGMARTIEPAAERDGSQ